MGADRNQRYRCVRLPLVQSHRSRARISRYELDVREPPVDTARLIAAALKVPLAYLFCEDDAIASLLLSLHKLSNAQLATRVRQFSEMLTEAGE